MLDDRRQRLVSVLLRVICIAKDHRRRTVVDAGCVAGGHRAVTLERTELRHCFQARIGAHRFVAIDDDVRLLAGHKGRICRIIERELVRRLVFPDVIGGADRCRNAHAALTRKFLDDDLVLRLARNLNRNDLVGKMSGGVRRARAPMALERKAVLLFARETQLRRDFASLRRHRHREILIPQPVVHHRVDQRAVAEAIPKARIA